MFDVISVLLFIICLTLIYKASTGELIPDEISSMSLDLDNEICYTESNENEAAYSEEEIAEIFDFTEGFGCTEIADNLENPETEGISLFTAQVLYSSTASFTAEQKIKPVDVVFLVDCTDNLQDNFDNVKANIISAGEEIYSMCDSARICVITFWASATPSYGTRMWATSLSQLQTRVNSITQRNDIANSLHGEALKFVANSLTYRSTAERFGFLIFDEYSQSDDVMVDTEIVSTVQNIANKSVNFSITYTILCVPQ